MFALYRTKIVGSGSLEIRIRVLGSGVQEITVYCGSETAVQGSTATF